MMRLDLVGLGLGAVVVLGVASDGAPAAPRAPQDGAALVRRLTGHAMDPRLTRAAVQALCDEFLDGRFDEAGKRRLGIPVADVRARFGSPHFDVGVDRPLFVYRMTDGAIIAMQTCDRGEYVLNVYEVEHEPAIGATGLASLGALQSMLCFWGC